MQYGIMPAMKYSVPRGTKDILPEEAKIWQLLEQTCRDVFALYNYSELRTPIFEQTELFTRSIGESTDIVGKEMYEFKDRKGRSLTLRPEATAPVVRAALENNLIGPDKLTKLYYIGPMFRYERPQAGRQRQFHQAGVEVFGSSDPLIDIEVIKLNVDLFKALGLTGLVVNINTVGCKECRPDYIKNLKKYFKDKAPKMCNDCQERLGKNALRVLDCKNKQCQDYIAQAPVLFDAVCSDCKEHFNNVNSGLKLQGISPVLNQRLVRGLDYYNETTFEIVWEGLGSQNAVSGGGRYDSLVAEFGGKSTPAVGFAIGLERLITVLKTQNSQPTTCNSVELFIATLGAEAKQEGFKLISAARAKGVSADMDYQGKSLKAQMKAADRLGAKYVYIIGEDELAKKCAILKKMESGDQKEVSFANLIAEVM